MLPTQQEPFKLPKPQPGTLGGYTPMAPKLPTGMTGTPLGQPTPQVPPTSMSPTTVPPPQILGQPAQPKPMTVPPMMGGGAGGYQPVSPTLPVSKLAPPPAAPTNPNELRGQVFKPGLGGGTQEAANYTSGLAGNLTNYQFPTFQQVPGADYGGARDLYSKAGQQAGTDYTPSADTQSVRDMVLKSLQGAQGPDRAGLAADTYGRLESMSRPGYDQTLRDVGRKNAALGRVGSGMVTNQLMDVTAQRERDLGNIRGQLATDAAGQTLADKLASLNATSGVFGQFGGEDRANQGARLAGANFTAGLGDRSAGLARDEAGFAQGERNAGLAYGLDQFGAKSGLLGQMAGLEGQRFNQDVTGRNEMRSERDFQNQMSQQGIQNELARQQQQEQMFGNDFTRQLQAAQTYGGLGFGGDPSSAYFTGAGQYGQQAQNGAAGTGDLAQNWSYLDWLKKNGGMQGGAM